MVNCERTSTQNGFLTEFPWLNQLKSLSSVWMRVCDEIIVS